MKKHELINKIPHIIINNEDELLFITKLFFNDWLFRGQHDARWNLKTSLERYHNAFQKELASSSDISLTRIQECSAFRLKSGVEHKAIEYFKRMAHYDGDEISALALMQHYGGRTRLLDVTNSLFIAMYFAFEDFLSLDDNEKKTDKITAKAVWCFNKKVILENYGYDVLKNNGYSNNEDNADVADELKKILINEKLLKKANEIIKNDTMLEEEQKVGIIPLLLPGMNERINGQNAAFLFPCSITKSFEDNFYESQYMGKSEQLSIQFITDFCNEHGNDIFEKVPLIKITIPVKCRVHVENILRHANISSFSIYPDLTGIAKSIRYW